jgi:tripartite ATP-independent transporter DctM subunit
MFDLVDRVLRGYTRALDMLGGLFLAVMVVLVFGNVVLRYAFNSGLTMSEEVSRWLFVWLTFMGAVVMFLVAAAMVSAWLITVADLPSKIIGMLEPFMGNQTLLLVAIMLLVMIVGTAMDMTPTILILTPVLMPVVKAAGIDPVYFGVLFIINNAIGLITPPVGTVLNVVAGVGRISMSDVTRGVMPFMLAQFAVMFLLVAFPSIVMVPLRLLGG